MDIETIGIDRVYRFKHKHHHPDDAGKPVLVMAVKHDGDISILSVGPDHIGYGIAYADELSDYTPDEFSAVVNSGAVANLYTERVSRLITKMFRTGVVHQSQD